MLSYSNSTVIVIVIVIVITHHCYVGWDHVAEYMARMQVCRFSAFAAGEGHGRQVSSSPWSLGLLGLFVSLVCWTVFVLFLFCFILLLSFLAATRGQSRMSLTLLFVWVVELPCCFRVAILLRNRIESYMLRQNNCLKPFTSEVQSQ